MRAFLPLMLAALVAPLAAMAHDTVLTREPDGFLCRAGDESRSSTQVIDDHLASLFSGDMNTFFCTYGHEAVVIHPDHVTRGRAAIRDEFIATFGALAGAAPVITSRISHDDVTLITYEIHLPIFTVIGTETYVVKHGEIVSQTVRFTFGPPDP